MGGTARTWSRIAAVLAAAGTVAVAAAAVEGAATATPLVITYPGNGNIYSINADGSNRQVLVSGGKTFSVDHWGGIAWSRDGKKLAFTVGSHRAGGPYGAKLQLYTASADGTNARPLTTMVGVFDPSWSPDGSRIAFTIRKPNQSSIAVVGADGRGVRTLFTTHDEFAWVPDWSPDGAWILFEVAQSDGVRTSLMEVHPDGTGLRRIATIKTGDHCLCADWSPDGRRIAFQAPAPAAKPRYGYPEIWVMSSDARDRVQLTKNAVRDENPDWSPDGTTLAFYSERAGNAEIYVIPAVGGQARRVTHDPWYDGPPRWVPAG